MIGDPATLVLAAFLAFCRIGACFLVMPGLSSVRIPPQVRLFVAVAATFALLAHLSDAIVPAVNRQAGPLMLLILSELVVGAMIGLAARFYILALQFIGSAIAMLIGYGGMGGPAIEEPEPQAALAAIISLTALLLLFALDFHHEIVRALVDSYRIIPVDGVFDAQGALVQLTDSLSAAFMVMLRLGSPFVAYAILMNVAIGFVNKLTPQIPVYFISLPFVIGMGLLLLYFGAASFFSLFGEAFFADHHGAVTVADRVKRLKGLVATQAKVQALHEARHAGLLAKAQAAKAEAEEISARAYGEGSLAMLFPELYAQRIEAAFRQRDESLLAAQAEAGKVATARMRVEKLAEMHRTASQAAERTGAERDILEFVSLTVRGEG